MGPARPSPCKKTMNAPRARPAVPNSRIAGRDEDMANSFGSHTRLLDSPSTWRSDLSASIISSDKYLGELIRPSGDGAWQDPGRQSLRNRHVWTGRPVGERADHADLRE